MKLSPKKNKWVKILLILFAGGLIFGGLLYYIVVKKFENIIQLTVEKESNGLYFFEATKVQLNLLNKSIQVKDAIVSCTDTTLVQSYHELRTPKIYLRVNSWLDLILHKKLIVDSLDIDYPSLTTHDHVKDKKEEKTIAFHTSSIFDMLQKLAANLEIRSLKIQNGEYTYSNNKNDQPFSCNHIFLNIKNFSKKEGKTTRLFSSDDLDISLYNQHWKLPNGIHDISFKRVHFSGIKQFFELDTCTFHKAAEAGKSEITLSADQFFFNSKRLTAIHEKEELLIDTLICFRPVLSITSSDKNQIIPDSIGSVSQSIKGLFRNINLKYIDIREGQLALTPISNNNNLNTTRTNLKIYNLTINPFIEPHISTDSIKLNLNKILFFTKDSLNQLSVEEFKLHNNDIIFINAVYGPTPANHSIKAITFKTTALQLKNINLEELVRKKLQASQADLYNPTITMVFPGKEIKRKKVNKKTAQFFETLHDISELIKVPDFNILNGSLHYEMGGISPLKMEMKNLNAHIFLTHFLVSDSLIDLKRSIPILKVDEISVQTPGLKLDINGYNFEGNFRHNRATSFQLTLANKTSIKGKNIYWNILDWDQYVNRRTILIDTLLAKELTIQSESALQLTTRHDNVKLPMLNIHRFEIGQLNFNSSNNTNSLRFTLTNGGVDKISTENNSLLWQKANATINKLVYSNKNSLVTIGKINFNNNETLVYETAVSNINDNGEIKVKIPELKINATFNTTNYQLLHLASLVATNPQIVMLNKPGLTNGTNPAAIKIPLRLIADKCFLNDATIRQTTVKENDTTTITTRATVDISNLQTNKHASAFITFDHAVFDLTDIQFKNSNFKVDVPKMNGMLTNSMLENTNSGGLSFTSGITAQWMGAAINSQKQGGTALQAIDIKGSFKDDSFSFQPTTKIQWPQLLTKTTLHDAKLYYRNKTITAKAGSIEWDPQKKIFFARKFSVLPNLGEAETFSKAEWQKDYVTVEGETTSISGLNFDQLQTTDAILKIDAIEIENTTLQATRDRNIPFKHNIEKLMPGALMYSLKKKIQVDSIFIKNSNITVHEIAVKTNKKASIPITHLNATITNFNNTRNDSLTVYADAFILDNKVSKFFYKEAKKDSLSFFQVKVNVAPMELTSLNEVTIPIANIRIKKGSVDTLYAAWAGNKNAAAGTMNFYYHQLKIQLLDKNDIEKNRFILSIASNLSSLVFRNKNDKPALIYFIRDKEKFVFNYWVKTIASGILTSAGIRKDKKYIKQYNMVKEKYALPEMKQ